MAMVLALFQHLRRTPRPSPRQELESRESDAIGRGPQTGTGPSAAASSRTSTVTVSASSRSTSSSSSTPSETRTRTRMVVLNEKETAQMALPAPIQSPPPYASAADVQQQYLLHLQQQHQQAQAQQLYLQQQLAALHSHSHSHSYSRPPPTTRGPSSPLTPTLPAPAYSPYTQLSGMPPGVMLKIVYDIFPAPGTDPTFVRLRRTLFWLAMSLRAVNKAFYTACMHVLRSSYLPEYTQNVRPPYTSDPFPIGGGSGGGGGADGDQRETAVLDRWLLLKVREDVLADESELHLDLDAQRDVFDMLQPRARTEDLVRALGVRSGVVSTSTSTSTSPPLSQRAAYPYPFAALSVVFEPRRVALVLATRGGRRIPLAEVPRARDETLESSAKKIVGQLVRQCKASH